MTYKPKSNLTSSIPVGSIIPIHPEIDFNKIINDNYWKPCDGACGLTIRYPDGTYYCGACNNFDIPLINDDVFLMGSSESTISSGGSNNLSDHKHCTSGSNLTAEGQVSVCNRYSSLDGCHRHSENYGAVWLCANDRTHCHTQRVTANTGSPGVRVDYHQDTEITGAQQGAYNYEGNQYHCHNWTGVWITSTGNSANHTHTVSLTHLHGSSIVEGDVGGGLDISLGTTEGRPSYISSKFYFKVK